MATYAQDKPINYREVYFTHETLRKIHGNPTYNDICTSKSKPMLHPYRALSVVANMDT